MPLPLLAYPILAFSSRRGYLAPLFFLYRILRVRTLCGSQLARDELDGFACDRVFPRASFCSRLQVSGLEAKQKPSMNIRPGRMQDG